MQRATPGFYTHGEVLRQQVRRPHDAALVQGWQVRLIMDPGEDSILPEVELWPDRLVIRLTRYIDNRGRFL